MENLRPVGDSMIVIHEHSGTTRPDPGYVQVYGYRGSLMIGHPDGTVNSGNTSSLSLTELSDVSGVFSSGHSPGWNGTNFVPTLVDPGTPQGPQGFTTTYTDVSGAWVSGQMARFDGAKWIGNAKVQVQTQIQELLYSNTITTSGFWVVPLGTTAYDRIEFYGKLKASYATGLDTTAASMVVWFNNDTAVANYNRIWGASSNGFTTVDSSNTYGWGQLASASSSLAGAVGVLVMNLKNNRQAGVVKTLEARQSSHGRGGWYVWGDHVGQSWRDINTPISGVSIQANNANPCFASGSYLRVVGYRTVTQWIEP